MDITALTIRIAKIIASEKLGELSSEENKILQAWLAGDARNKEHYDELRDDKKLAEILMEMDHYDVEKNYREVRSLIKPERKGRLIIFQSGWVRYAAAIVFLLAGSFIAYIYLNRQTTGHQIAYQIQPGTQKAFLTTSDNQRVALGNRKQKAMYTDRNALIVDTGSTLIYKIRKVLEDKAADIAYNQLETPRGGEYTLILPDGSAVKLNSQSRIRFPVSFDERSRQVELEGEAFFDIVKSDAVPFIVSTSGMKITVYGTSFNVSAYDDDNYIQTTLVNGGVGISLPGSNNQVELKLMPGQQAHYNKELHSVETKEVNTALYTAWTKGLFVFENEPLESILQKLARWYDCEVEFRDDSLRSEPFTGELERYDSIAKILDMISIASDVGFTVEDRKVIVVSEK